MEPTVGRIVHYNTDTDRKVAAVVTYVWGPEVVNLNLIGDGSYDEFDSKRITSVQQGVEAWQWDWPVRADAPAVALEAAVEAVAEEALSNAVDAAAEITDEVTPARAAD